jgi:FMN phosphatase YigB (HAD superfamily)
MTIVASFDVFDTVLTRAVGSPEAVFLTLGRRLLQAGLIAVTPQAFAHARIEAERRAYKNAGRTTGECTLDAIYAELGAALRLNHSQEQDLLERECSLEAELIRVIPDASERVDRARSLGQKVVYLSDMYLPSTFIQEQLARWGLWRDGDRCYISSEHQKSKQSGALFAELLRETAVLPHQITHQGNNPGRDIQPAIRTGLGADPYLDANLNRYEALLEAHAETSEGLSSALAGASRLARLSVVAATPKEAMLRDVTAGVAAPTLVGFMLWILQRAQQLGLQRLYFLSRDGQVLLAVARRLAQKLNLSCELRYLYGSRQAWNLPAIRQGSDEELAWIWDRTDVLSVKSLLARVGLEPPQLREPLETAGLGYQDWSRPLRDAERSVLRQILETRLGRELILQQAKQKRQVLLEYLKQEGVLGTSPWGFVDLGWYGSMQNSLAWLVAEEGGTPPKGFYFALYQGAVADRGSPVRDAYFFDERRDLGYREAVPDLIALMEMFCVADHGTVIGFGEEAGQIRPVLKEASNKPVVDWGLHKIRETIEHFMDALLLDADLVNPAADIRETITDVLRAFWVDPTVREATAWADFPWEDGLGAETYRNRLARPYGWGDVVKTILRGQFELHHRAAWHAGSLALSPPEIRFALRVAHRTVRKLRPLRARLKLGQRFKIRSLS